jgi:hypothetical protein
LDHESPFRPAASSVQPRVPDSPTPPSVHVSDGHCCLGISTRSCSTTMLSCQTLSGRREV